ncbi:MAG TPA: penicillin-binding protein [Bacteroidetes bacterium]|nr:penicillin-binding protein [Bacteroidota bacterium]
MADKPYSDAELERYFADADARRDAPEGDDLADFFDSPDGSASRPAAARRSGDGASDDAELAAFFASPDYGGDGASGVVLPPPPPQTPRSAQRRRTLRALSVVLALVALVGLAGLGVVAYFWPQLPSLEQIENPKNLLATVVMTADDVELARYYQNENRTWVPLDSISPHVTNALLATEDRRFYDHWGVDAIAMGAIVKDAITQGDFRGASTVTMQLARNLYREDVNFVIGEKSVVRKIKEILTSIRIERIYTKDEILEAYLNTVPFLYNAYGIQSASETYFAKDAADLNPQEAAVLVGMLAANDYFDPAKGRPEGEIVFESVNENSIRRRNQVLANMAGQGVLDGDLAELQATPIQLTFNPYSHEDNLAPHFAEVLRLWFKEWAERNNYDPYADGLVIRTTIDSRMQELAAEAVAEQMDQLQAITDRSWGSSSDPFGYWWRRNTAVVNEYIADTESYQRLRRDGVAREDAIAQLRQNPTYMDSLRSVKTRVEAGLVAIDPRTGQVKAWVGGRDYVADQYDHVGTARRQPGSTFKAFAYTTAFAEGYSPQSYVSGGPFKWGDWTPKNSGGGGGYMSVAAALAGSVNTAAARITKHFGPEKIKETAEEMGIRSPIEPVRSIALGTNDVNLLEMVAAYSTIASGGIYHGPTMGEERPSDPAVPPHITLAVDRIEDRYGNVIEDFTPAGREVLNPSVAYTTASTMRGVIRSGTARSLGSRFSATRRLDLAGKTGTTQENADGWFIAMHPHLVVGSWTGFNDRRIKFRTTALGQGARTALPNVGAFFHKLQADSTVALDPDARFEKPENYSAGRSARIGGAATWSGDRTSRRPSSGGSSESREEQNAARGMIDDYRQRDRQQAPAPAPAPAPPEGGGRIGW